jgi:hypothetical protein
LSEYDSLKVFAVACPKCEAKSGNTCVTDSGKKTDYFHTARKAVVYPSWNKNSVSGSQSPRVISSERSRLRKEVINKAIAWSGAEHPYDSKVLPQREKALVNACLDLAHHRVQHPGLQG